LPASCCCFTSRLPPSPPTKSCGDVHNRRPSAEQAESAAIGTATCTIWNQRCAAHSLDCPRPSPPTAPARSSLLSTRTPPTRSRIRCARRPTPNQSTRRARTLSMRVQGEIMGSQNYRNVGESQSALIMIDPIISPRTRTPCAAGGTQRRNRESHEHLPAVLSRICDRAAPVCREPMCPYTAIVTTRQHPHLSARMCCTTQRIITLKSENHHATECVLASQMAFNISLPNWCQRRHSELASPGRAPLRTCMNASRSGAHCARATYTSSFPSVGAAYGEGTTAAGLAPLSENGSILYGKT
jgi:hypothetical protein